MLHPRQPKKHGIKGDHFSTTLPTLPPFSSSATTEKPAMRRRHLQELLGEEQEPFVLQTFLDEKRSLLLLHRELHGVPQPTTLQNHATNLPSSTVVLCKSPPPPASKTTAAALLRDAAVRIHRHHQQNNGKRKVVATMRRRRTGKERPRDVAASRVAGFGLVVFSLLKRFLHRQPHREIRNEDDDDESSRVSVRDVLSFRWDSPVAEEIEKAHSCCEEEGEEGEGEEEEEPINVQCSSGSQPQCCLGSLASPTSHRSRPETMLGTIGDGEGNAMEKPYNCTEEDKDQYSPVSVLDPPFIEDHRDNHHRHEAEAEDEVEGDEDEVEAEQQQVKMELEVHLHDFQQEFATMQRCRKELLSKAKRPKGLDGLEPFNLEKEISRLEERAQGWTEDDDDVGWSPMRRLIRDLIAEERASSGREEEVGCVAEEVKRRIEGWREVEADTIDMMVELDLSRESGGWSRRKEEEVWDVAGGIELSILWVLVEEVVGELHVLSHM